MTTTSFVFKGTVEKRQRPILVDFSPGEAQSLLHVAAELDNSEEMVNLLEITGRH
jgi:hypothetical protein